MTLLLLSNVGVILKPKPPLGRVEDTSMPLCPLDYRYGRDAVKDIWSDLGRHSRQLEVERALIWAHKELGKV